MSALKEQADPILFITAHIGHNNSINNITLSKRSL